MTPHVMKRDGCKVPFKSERIKEAILRAAKAAEVDDADYCATVAAVVSEQMQGRNQVDICLLYTSIICTISVCDSKPTTNHPDWNSVCVSGVLAWNTHHIRQNVRISKIELIGPKKIIKRPRSAGFQRCGF